MTLLRRFFNLRNGLISVSCVSAVWFLLHTAPDLETAQRFYIDSAFYFCFALFVLWGTWLVKTVITEKQPLRSRASQILPGIAIALILCGITAVTVEPRVRVLNDHSKLLSQAQAMFYFKKAGIINQAELHFDLPKTSEFHFEIPGRPDFESGQPKTADFLLPMRPPLFSFLVSIVHTLTRYRAENAYVLNYLILLALLSAVYAVIRIKSTAASAGAALFLVAAQPIFSLSAASPGYDLLFLACLSGCGLSTWYFLKRRSALSFEMLWLNLLMLAYVRVESLLYGLIFLAVLAIRGHLRRDLFRSMLIFTISPWLLVPVVWNKYLTFGDAVSNYGSYLRDHVSFDYLIHNAATFVAAIANFGFKLPYANPVNLVGLLAIGAAAASIIPLWRRSGAAARTLSLAVAAVTAANVCIMLSMKCGSPVYQPAARFFLLPCFLLSIGAFLLLDRRVIPKNVRMLLPLIAVITFCLYHPVAMKDRMTREYGGWVRRYDFVMDYFKNKDMSECFIISESPLRYIVHGAGGCNFSYANQHVQTIVRKIKQGRYANVYAVQDVNMFSDRPNPPFWLRPLFTLKEEGRSRKSITNVTRISRVVL